MLLRFCCLCGCFLCGLAFVVDCGAGFGENFWRHLLHVVRGLGVFVGFVENFVLGVGRARGHRAGRAGLKTAAT